MEDNTLISRTSVPELDAILGKKFKVLDDGFIRVIDYMGNDSYWGSFGVPLFG